MGENNQKTWREHKRHGGVARREKYGKQSLKREKYQHPLCVTAKKGEDNGVA